MAIYDYKCRVCDDMIQVNHSINDSPAVLCGKCESKRVKVISAPAVAFKGTGWGKDN